MEHQLFQFLHGRKRIQESDEEVSDTGKRVLYFIGHYDYLLPSILLGSGLYEDGPASDFIVLQTKNSLATKNFIRQKTEDAGRIGRFATVQDEKFLGLSSEERTEQAILKTYDRIFEAFGTSLLDYDHIYMSFDEWNSFGIYLALQENNLPVRVLVKDPAQLEQDIYHYISGRGKRIFGSLQEKYRVLNENEGRIREVIALHHWEYGSTFGEIPICPFDYEKRLMELDDEKKDYLLSFFAVEGQTLPEYICTKQSEMSAAGAYPDSAVNLAVLDSLWFRSDCLTPDYDYIRYYQLAFSQVLSAGESLAIKEHPRYSIDAMAAELAFETKLIIPGYIPTALLALCPHFHPGKVISIGNPVQGCVIRDAKEVLLPGVFFAEADILNRLRAAQALARQLGYSTAHCSGITQEELDCYQRFFADSENETVLTLDVPENPNNAFLIFRTAAGEQYRNEIAVYLQTNTVVVLKPEKDFACLDREEYIQMKDWMYSFRMKKISLEHHAFYNRYEELMWVFTACEELREDIEVFSYQKELPWSGYLLQTVLSIQTKKHIQKLPGKAESKAYIARKAKTRPVVIYGASEVAYRFLRKYGKYLNVRCVMTDNMKNVDSRIRKRYKVVRYKKSRIHRKDYILVCKSFIHNVDRLPDYAVTRDRLLREGFRVCRDFSYYRLFEAHEANKKIMLFCGYCEMSGIKQVLELTSADNDYCMLFYHIGRETMRQAPGYRDFVASAKMCDILVHAPLTIKRGVLDADVLSLIPERTQTIFITQISFRGYAPYKSIKFTRRNYDLRLMGTIYYPFLYEVSILNDLIRAGYTNQEIYDIVSNPDLYTKEEVLRNAAMALRILQIMDSQSDISIYGYVRDHYREAYLFKDCVHANDALFFEYARKLSWYLSHPEYVEEIDRIESLCKEQNAYFQVATEEPVFPSVAKHLGLEFAKDKKYMLKVTEEHIRMVDFQEWIYEYCDYFRAVRTVRRVLNPRFCTQQVTILRNELKKYSMNRFLLEETGDGLIDEEEWEEEEASEGLTETEDTI